MSTPETEVQMLKATLEAYRKRARKLYTPDVAATKIAEDEARMRDVDKQLEITTATLRYFGLEVVNEIGEGVKMLITDEKNGVNQCAYVRVIPGGSYAGDQSELRILREEFDKAQASLSAPPADAPTQQEIIVWLAHMVSFNEQLAANESADARDREKFRNYASAYNSALTKAKQFAQPSASVQEAAERAIDAVGMGLYANDTFKFYPEKRAALASIIASHFAGFEQREGK